MKTYHLLICILSICLSACSRPAERKDSDTDRLPFFRDAQLTPEWIEADELDREPIHRIPAFSLTDQAGARFTETGMNDRICVTNFFFARCRSICPKMTQQLKYLYDTLGKAPDVRFLSFSVDPEADSIPVLRAFGEQYGLDPEHWKLLTGDRTAVYQLAKKGLMAGDSTGITSASEEFLHTENVILTDKKRRIRGVYNGTLRVEMDRLFEDIRILRKEESID